MNEASKKVIILNKLSSPYISEAIIILKDGAVLPQSRIVAEAEQIVRSYMERNTKNGQALKRPVRLCKLKTAALLCFATAVAVFFTCLAIFQ